MTNSRRVDQTSPEDRSCPEERSLRAFANGELAAADEDAVAEHVDRCAECEKRLARIERAAGVGVQGAAPLDDPYMAEREYREAFRRIRQLGEALPNDNSDRNDGDPRSLGDNPSTIDASLGDTGDRLKMPGDVKSTIDHLSHKPAAAPQLPEVDGYEVLSFVARGGMGVVVKARHRVLNRIVAIKMPRGERLSLDEQERQRFLREARAAAKLAHPNICPIFEVGETDGRPFLAMAFVEGMTLSDWFAKSEPNARKMAEVMTLLARAVAYAHDNGVLHRDLKPANVMVDHKSGEPVLMDFGLAKEFTDADCDVDGVGAGQSPLTVTGQVMGTPAFMAPEQAAGETDRIGPATDVYALGAILYYLLCGRAPFSGNLAELLAKVRNEEPPRPAKLSPRVHRDLETICLRAMAKEPAARYATAGELADDLARFCAGEPILARRERVWETAARFLRRRPAIAAFAIATLTLTIALSVLGWKYGNSAELTRRRIRFEAELHSADWTASELDVLKQRLGDVAEIDRDVADVLREQLVRQFSDHLAELIQSPRMTDEIQHRIESGLVLIEPWDSSAADGFRQRYLGRLRDWEPIFHLAAPFDNLPDVLDPKKAASHDSVLFGVETTSFITRVRSSGQVRLQVEFADGWTDARELAIGIGVDGEVPANTGYRFELHGVQFDRDGKLPFRELREAGGVAIQRILRNGLALREMQTPIPDGPLRFTAWRESQRLMFQINDLPPLEFTDPFPLSDGEQSVFAVIAKEPVGLVSVTGSRQPLPPEASLLEKGDEWFLQGDLAEALAEYERHAASADSSAAMESRYKQAQCLASMRRFSEANAILKRLAEEPGDQWPALANCLLWELTLAENGPDAAYGIFENITYRHRPERLRTVVPAYLIQHSVFQYREDASGLQMLEFNPLRVRNLTRAVNMHEFFGIEDVAYYESKLYLARAHCMEGENKKALAAVKDLIDKLPDATPALRRRWFQMWETYGWLMRLEGRSPAAIAALDLRLFDSQKQIREPHRLLLIERARLRLANGDAQGAAADMTAFFEKAEPANVEYEYYSGACLVRGFALEELGRHDDAMAAWRAGLPNAPYDWLTIRSIEGLLHGMILASLTGDISAGELSALADRVIRKLGTIISPFVLRATVGAIMDDFSFESAAHIIQQISRRPGGQELARHVALRTLPLNEMLQTTSGILTAAVASELLVEDERKPDQERLAQKLGEDIAALYLKGEFTRTHLLQVVLTWKGVSGPGGWKDLSGQLQPNVRGPLAYGLGLRYLRRNDPKQAAAFFQTALSDAESAGHDELAQLAREELEQMAPDNSPESPPSE